MLDTKQAVDEIIQEEQISAEQSEIMRLRRELSQVSTRAAIVESKLAYAARRVFIANEIIVLMSHTSLTHGEKRGALKLVECALRDTQLESAFNYDGIDLYRWSYSL